MKPKTIMHTQISLDGQIKGFDNSDIYYSVANQFNVDTILFGSNTVKTAFVNYSEEMISDFEKPNYTEDDPRPIGVIPDSRGILRNLHCMRRMGYLKDIVILVSQTTPVEYLHYLEERNFDYLIAGDNHVDYKQAFHELYKKYNTRAIRTDSGGTLTNVLLANGFIDEISLVISPCLVGNIDKNMFEGLHLKEKVNLELINIDIINTNYIALLYRVIK